MSSLLAQALMNSLVLTMSLALIAVGLSLVYGILSIVNFAHGEVFMAGAYIFWVIFAKLGMNVIVGVVAAMAFTTLLSILIYRVAFKPTRKVPMMGFITAMGIVLILQTSAQGIFGSDGLTVPYFPGFAGIVKLGSVTFAAQRVLIIVAGAVSIVVLAMFLRYHKWGKGLQALSQDADAAQLQGISVDKGSQLAIVLGGLMAGLAGALLGPLSYVQPFMGGVPILKGLTAIVIGGIGSFPGTIIGCAIWGLVEGLGGTYLDSSVAFMLMYGLFIGIILLRPTGFLGREASH